MMKDNITIALPKGRILDDLLPILKRADIIPSEEFFDPKTRKLYFDSNHPNIKIIRVRSFDCPSFVAYNAADIAVAGLDVIKEHDLPNINLPLKLNIGKCRVCLAGKKDSDFNLDKNKKIRIASKYTNISAGFLKANNINAEIIKLNGAIELAPIFSVSDYIIDLVSTGATLEANGLEIKQDIMDISSYLIVNRNSYKTHNREIFDIIQRFKKAIA